MGYTVGACESNKPCQGLSRPCCERNRYCFQAAHPIMLQLISPPSARSHSGRFWVSEIESGAFRAIDPV